MNNQEIFERVNTEPVQSKYLLAVITPSKKWQGIIADGDKRVTVNGNGPTIIPFKGKNLTHDLVIYNAIIQKLAKDGDLLVSVIKNGVPIDVNKTSESFGTVSLIGKCLGKADSIRVEEIKKKDSIFNDILRML